MSAPQPRVTFRNMDSSAAVEERIRKRVIRLLKRAPRIQDCHVTVEAPNQHKGGLFRIGVNINLPGAEIVVAHEGPNDPAHADVYAAIRDTFDAAERRLVERLRQTNGAVAGRSSGSADAGS